MSLQYSDKTDRISTMVRTPSGGGTAQQIAYTYDGSLVTGRTFSGVANGQFTYTYDNNFFLKQIKLVSGANTVTTPITRDADGLVTAYGPFTFTRSGPAGAVSNISGTGLAIAITYDSLGRPSSRTHTVSSKNIYSVQFAYDSTGNIVQKTETIPGLPAAWEYAYDADGQLSQAKKNGATEELYSYDVNGNRTKYEYPGPDGWVVSASFDEQDRIIQQWQASYQFNPDGQMTQRGSDTFQYSAMGELLQAMVTGQNVAYAYDGMGRRIGKTDSTGTSQYLYGDLKNPFQLTAMRDPAGVLTTFYYEAGLLFAMDKGGARYYIAADQVGTPRVVSDSSGNVVKIAEWDSYGWHKFDTNIDFALPVGFAGGLADVKTGLVRFGYRDYEPATGRWTAKDPIFFKGGQGNLFGYVQNRPTKLIDPSGLFTPPEYPMGQVGISGPGGPGATALGAAGGVLGGAAGARAGMAAGMEYGAALGLGGGPLGSLGGAILGGALGAIGGSIIGGELGGMLGDMLFDPPGSGELNNEPPVPTVPKSPPMLPCH